MKFQKQKPITKKTPNIPVSQIRKELSPDELRKLLEILKKRFEINVNRHKELK